jgi:Sec-independent protein secretion pathway component TatC
MTIYCSICFLIIHLPVDTVNIAGFAGPSASTLTPHIPHAASPLDEASFAATFLLFEGKMRALFTVLFGASMMLFLERITIFSVKDYTSKWRMAVLVIFVISMILTPSDPYSMTLMAIPLTFLYFGGVLLCMFMPRQRSPYDVALAD